MNLQVTGLHMEVGDSLRAHCETAVNAIAPYFPDLVDVKVQFKQKGHKNIADVKVHASQIHLRAEAEGEDFYLALDHSMEKLIRQLDKYKGRLQKHRRRRDQDKFDTAQVVQAIHNRLVESELDDMPEEGTYAPNVTQKVVKEIQTLTVDEAVMQMDLMHLNVFIFNNVHTGALNVVYREDDESIGWVETDKVEKVARSA